MIWLAFGLSFFLSLILIPVIRRLGIRWGLVKLPRSDRWHRNPTPTFGGVSIFFALLISLFAVSVILDDGSMIQWNVLVGSAFVFLLGLYDDIKPVSPPTKLLVQILAATVVISSGYTTEFFTPKIENRILAQLPNVLLTYIWLVGITNAINLLDNMDGLASGISLISAAILSYFFWLTEDWSLLYVSLALIGSLLGFLVYNFPPAKIFMGDSGSQFIGFTLATLAIARQPQASNIFAVLGVPTLIFMLPILDTLFVTFTRILRGQSPAHGDRDHTSHRLIAFGLTERQALFVLYGVALLSGVMAIAVENIDYWLSLVLVPLLVLSLTLIAAYLARLRVVESSTPAKTSAITRLMVELTYKRRILEIILDFFLIGIAYYLSFWVFEGLMISGESLGVLLITLPFAYAGTYVSYIIFGVYRGVWRYLGVDDLLRYAIATLGSVGLLFLFAYLFPSLPELNPSIYLLFAIFLFLSLAASRFSFRVLDQFYYQRTLMRESKTPILILGAGDAGEMAVRWINMHPQLGYQPMGFLDNNPYNAGRQIHGVGILGSLDKLEIVLEQKNIGGVVIAVDGDLSEDVMEEIIQRCQQRGIWLKVLRFELDLIG